MDSSIIPFLPEVYDHIVANYNDRLWPTHIIAVLVGFVILGTALRAITGHARTPAILLGLAHLWIAWGFYVQELVPYSWGAWIFALLFGIEGVALVFIGVLGNGLNLNSGSRVPPRFTLIVCLYALLLHPLFAAGLRYEPGLMMPFGLHPAPTLMFTFGLLVMTGGTQRWLLFMAPLLVGALVTLLSNAMGHTADLAVLPVALLALVTMVINRQRTR